MEQLKQAAARCAVEWVTSGTVVGLGSGTTARYATLGIAERLRAGDLHDVLAVPTSEETAQLARAEGIPLTTLDEHPGVDLTIDGADEVDPDLDVIKGRHGFVLREKIVAAASRQEIIVVDESKLVARLGTRSPVPVEVVRFGWRSTLVALSRTGAHAALRLHDGQPFGTDEGHYIIDCTFESGIAAPRDVQAALQTIPGVVCTGLFLNMVQTVVVARTSGIHILRR